MPAHNDVDPPDRVALVLDIFELNHLDTQHLARRCLNEVHNYLTDRHIQAEPVRIDINGITRHIAPSRR